MTEWKPIETAPKDGKRAAEGDSSSAVVPRLPKRAHTRPTDSWFAAFRKGERVTEMIDRGARAILVCAQGQTWAFTEQKPVDLTNVMLDGQFNLVEFAAAVIAAVREPTNATGSGPESREKQA